MGGVYGRKAKDGSGARYLEVLRLLWLQVYAEWIEGPDIEYGIAFDFYEGEAMPGVAMGQ
ncbi:hypothetical protein CK934_20770 [Chitinophaga sp. MD30]|nr:hypothetical protein CK934_20770 [Chitinophaga sp. MD30]